MTTSAHTRNPRGEGGRLREEILDAAIALIDETDDATTLTLRGIARRAGISAPSIYAHFPDLASVTEQLLARSFDELYATVGHAASAEPNAPRALLAAAGAYVTFGWEHKARYRLMFSAGGYAPNAVKTFTLVKDCIHACAEAGLSDSTDPHHDAWMLWAGLHGVATLEKPARAEYLRLGTLDRPAMLKTIIQRLALIRDKPPDDR
jgi:AcrR family transcriptional regulator